ncbi:MAG: trypsin-like peptidase domain-containing protein [Firmicutes bacterium]|nr:trypsin-like peptidase domain-containing protein [Bacillota bacterium]
MYDDEKRNNGESQNQALFRDPRERFQSSRSYERVNGETGSFSGSGSASWNRGETKVKKPAEPIVLTRKSLALIIVLCLAASCLFGLGGAWIGLNAFSGNSQAESSGSASTIKSDNYTLEDATGSKMSVQEVTEAAKDSIVEIRTESTQTDSWLQSYVTEGAGSGVIISKDGYIMTNNHVIEDASKITVTTRKGTSYDATVIGSDSMNDVAVIKVKASDLSPVTYGNSDQIQVGDMAVAIGNPLGQLGGTVTAGIISATDRELTIDGSTMKLLQTDSSINPGNSGGGLFNDDGQLIGLVVAKSSGSDVEGLGFAIPVNTAANVASQLMDKGYVSGRPYTGMTYTEGSSGIESLFGPSSGSVYIYSVDTAKAKLAGFEPGDIVFAIDGKQISSIDDISAIVTKHKVGDKLKYTIVRDGNTKDLTLELQEKKGE